MEIVSEERSESMLFGEPYKDRRKSFLQITRSDEYK